MYMLGENGDTLVMMYRKTTHTDQYLNYGSIHYLQNKRSVIEPFMDRANKIISKQDEKAGTRHLRSSLRTNGYQEWMFKTKPKRKDSKLNIQQHQNTEFWPPIHQETVGEVNTDS